MRDRKKNIENSLGWIVDKRVSVNHPECKKTDRNKKISLSKKTEKIYKVTVTYIQLTDEEAKIKRAIIESILRKGYKGN